MQHTTSYLVRSDDSVYTVTPSDNSPEAISKWFHKLAHTIAFDDCSGEQIIFISYEGKELHYTGWKPNMLMEFADDKGNIIWSNEFPAWDH